METHNIVKISSQQFSDDSDLYQVVDFLNRALKEKHIVVGLSKSEEAGKLQITVYEENDIQ